jgi:hypothetical protein
VELRTTGVDIGWFGSAGGLPAVTATVAGERSGWSAASDSGVLTPEA